jgi:hypothetical protein
MTVILQKLAMRAKIRGIMACTGRNCATFSDKSGEKE